MKPHQIAILKNYVNFCIKTKEVKPSTFHSEYKPYHRKQTTLNLIQKAFKTQVLIEPRIYCIPDLEVNLHEYERIPLVPELVRYDGRFEQNSDDSEIDYFIPIQTKKKRFF